MLAITERHVAEIEAVEVQDIERIEDDVCWTRSGRFEKTYDSNALKSVFLKNSLVVTRRARWTWDAGFR